MVIGIWSLVICITYHPLPITRSIITHHLYAYYPQYHFLIDILMLKPLKLFRNMGILSGYMRILNTYIQNALQLFKFIVESISGARVASSNSKAVVAPPSCSLCSQSRFSGAKQVSRRPHLQTWVNAHVPATRIFIVPRACPWESIKGARVAPSPGKAV